MEEEVRLDRRLDEGKCAIYSEITAFIQYTGSIGVV